MRTNIEIDEALMHKAMAALGARTMREAVDRALRRVVSVAAQAQLKELRGIGWEGDLEAMRLD